MEAAAAHFLQLQLLPVDYFSQGPVDALNGIIDQLIPVRSGLYFCPTNTTVTYPAHHPHPTATHPQFYSVLVALIVASAHYHQWRLARRGPSLSPSDEELERQLWALERELLAAKRDAAAEQARKQQQQKQQQQQQKQLQQQEQQQKQSVADAHPLSEGSAAAGVQRCVLVCLTCVDSSIDMSTCMAMSTLDPAKVIQIKNPNNAGGTSRACGSPSRPRTSTTTSS